MFLGTPWPVRGAATGHMSGLYWWNRESGTVSSCLETSITTYFHGHILKILQILLKKIIQADVTKILLVSRKQIYNICVCVKAFWNYVFPNKHISYKPQQNTISNQTLSPWAFDGNELCYIFCLLRSQIVSFTL